MASQFPMARFGTTSRYTEILSDSDLNSTTYDPGRNAAYDPTKSGPPTDTFEVRQESPLRSRIGALLRPRPLNISSTRWLEFVPDFLNLLFTIAFIALGIAITRLKDQPESSWSHKVIAATQLAPTLWPILFAAVVGNAIKVFAQYRAERGATLGTLEQLMGSQTVASTVKTVYLLRAFGLYTLALLVIWAFNPLGSQASFRGVYLKDTFAMGTRLHSFQNSSMIYEAQQSALATGSGWQSSLPMVRSLYGASLFAPDAGTQYANGTSDGFQGLLLRLGGAHTVMQQMTTDVWGNVRIPDVQTLPSYTAGKKNDWVSVPNNVSVVNYTSIIGSPGRNGLPQFFGENISYPMASSYHDFKCVDWKNITYKDMSGWMKDNYHLMTNRHNATLDQEPYNAALQDLLPISSGFFLDTLGNVSASIKNPTSPSIVFVSRGWTSYYITTCMASMIYVDVNITCATTSRLSQATCAATSIRETSNPPTSTNYTAFSTVPNAYWIARSWPTIFGPQHSMTSTQTELFIADPSSAFVGAAATIKTVELGAVPINVFEKRFGLVFNTFWKASVAPSLIVGGDVSKANLELQPFINTTAAWSQFTPQVYALNTPWLALFFLSTLIMFIAAVFAIFFKMRSRSPDILGYVSTLTRDNPYMGLPAGGSALSGSERARILRDQKVMLVDVRDGEEVGRIAFAAVNDGGRKKELKTGRLYE